MDEQQKARLEAENGFRQLEQGVEIIKYYLEPGRPFSLRPGLILDLQKIAVEGLEQYPGQWRKTPVAISKSSHQPPGPHLVEGLVTEMCEYLNNSLHVKTAFHLSAYVMWRHNWIHPFGDGNGRTSRVLSYIVLSLTTGYLLPGSPTIPEQIQGDRSGYFKALEAADKAWSNGEKLDISAMEELLTGMLAKQLLSVIDGAAGNSIQELKDL
jgi:Fic family protein